MPVHRLGRNYTECLQEDRDAVILADKLGFSEAYVGEHLTDAAESITNAMLFQAASSRRLSRSNWAPAQRTYLTLIPCLWRPRRQCWIIFYRAVSFWDQPGCARSNAEALGIRGLDRNQMFAESITHILDIWGGEPPYDLRGKRWKISTRETLMPEIGLGPIVKPFQKPHPPIVCTVVAPFSKGVIEMGKRGFLPISANFLLDKWVKTHWDNYSQGCEESGREASSEDWRVARSIFVHDDHKTAIDYGKKHERSPYRFYFKQLYTKLKKAKRHEVFKPEKNFPDEELNLDYIVDNLVIAGDINSVVDQILAFREITGDFGTLLYAGKDWEDKELSKRSMELMATKVMPAINSAIGQSEATGVKPKVSK